MANFLKNLFGKKQTKPATKTNETVCAEVIPQSKYDFVKQYTIVHPRLVLINYNLFGGCSYIPVAHEVRSKTGFNHSVELPNHSVIWTFLEDLSATNPMDISPKARTISVLKKDNQIIYIIPNIKEPKTPVIFMPNAMEKGWSLGLTPEINRAIVEQMKIHTR